ncbi:MAG: M48 family metalloprotease, partial [Candidatus Humimicrobiaceae bacterium]
TTKANAYFTGMGKSKRIVIYDNLLKNFSEKEALAVIAHEMGHWKKMHLLKKMAVAVAGGILTIFIIKVIINSMNISHDFKAIIIAFLIFSLLSFVVMPLENYISRKFEKEADRLSVELTQKPEGHIQLMQKLAKSNLSNIEPNRIVKYIIYSHPPIIERIKAVSSSN